MMSQSVDAMLAGAAILGRFSLRAEGPENIPAETTAGAPIIMGRPREAVPPGPRNEPRILAWR